MHDSEGMEHFDSALDERERAAAYFRAVLAVHSAAIVAFELIPTLPDS